MLEGGSRFWSDFVHTCKVMRSEGHVKVDVSPALVFQIAALEVEYHGAIVEADRHGCLETWGGDQDRFPFVADVLEYF